jgi:NAD/NADP transhydrogenase alpha subunit
LSQISIFLASINIFGGFFLTFRMLEMFKQRKRK